MFTLEAFPRFHLQTSHALGQLFLRSRDFIEAQTIYKQAREAFLLLFGQGLEETEARDVIATAGSLFAEAAYVAARIGNGDAALFLVNEGKAKLLAVALKMRNLNLLPAKLQRVEQLRSAIREQERMYGATHGLARNPVSTNSRLVPDGHALAVPIVTRTGGAILILKHGEVPSVLDLPGLTTARIEKLMRGDGSKVGASGGWLGAYNVQYLRNYARIEEWTNAIENIGPELWNLFAGRLDARLQELGIRPGTRIVWLPAGALGLLPLGLALDPHGDRRLGEVYEIVTTPSLDAFGQSIRQAEQAPLPSLAAAVNPTGEIARLNLRFTEIEGAIVASHFFNKPQMILDKLNATPEAVLAALKGKSYWHFSSHGAFNWDDVRAGGCL
jgi:hypothetical protein